MTNAKAQVDKYNDKCQSSNDKQNAKAQMTNDKTKEDRMAGKRDNSGIKLFGFELTFGFCHLAFYCLYLLSASVVILSIEKSQEPRKVTSEE